MKVPFVTHRSVYWLGASWLALGLLVASGCGSRIDVTGKVLDKGKPIPGAQLSWVSETDPSVFGSGVADASGMYFIETGGKKGIPVGRYQVRVNWWRTKDGKPLPEGEEGAAMKNSPRARQFTATVSQEITSTTTTVDLDVSGKGTPIDDGT